jgi:membrane-bound lytic murein transglycosylase D
MAALLGACASLPGAPGAGSPPASEAQRPSPANLAVATPAATTGEAAAGASLGPTIPASLATATTTASTISPPTRPASDPDTAPTATAGRHGLPAAAPTAPAASPEPVVAAPAPEIDLWQRIRAGFAMPELDTPLVADKERFYLARPEYLQRMFQRGARYLFHIVEEIEKRGLPTELALLPFVESAMNPVALSPAQAAGLWQFIPSTGRAYDLRQDWWVDNRRDVVKSTQAALDYLQKIHAMHGNDWFLALASYNWGEGAVARAVRRNQSMGKPADYLSLTMPAETRHYVPKLIALKHIIQQAGTLGLALPPLPNRPYFVTVEKTRPIDLQLAARFAGMSVEEFVALNPAHNRPVISPTRNNGIKLPADRADAFRAAIANHEQQQQAFATWEPYTLKPGETLDSLARRTQVPVAELRRANGLREGSRIMPGTRLLAPQGGETVDEVRIESFVAPTVYEQVDRPAVYHTVGQKESLASIASRYRISAASLAAWNGLRSGISRGMRLLVQPAGTQTLLTTEQGERSVVSQTSQAPATAQTVALASTTPGAAPKAPRATAPGARKAAGESHRQPAAAGGKQARKDGSRTRQSQPRASRT